MNGKPSTLVNWLPNAPLTPKFWSTRARRISFLANNCIRISFSRRAGKPGKRRGRRRVVPQPAIGLVVENEEPVARGELEERVSARE